MSQLCVEDPLGTIKVAANLATQLETMGHSIVISSNPEELNVAKLAARNETVSPFFDAGICNFEPDRFFWMKLTSAGGEISALQAYRYDFVDTSLADWGPNLTIGLAMRRQELMIPTHASPPKNSLAERIRGKLVYHGECWVDPQARNRKLLENFSRLGMILSMIKWNPDAIWALSSSRMASFGHPNRMGYSYMEKGFLRWQWASEGIDLVEFLNVAERQSIEQMINEMKITQEALLA